MLRLFMRLVYGVRDWSSSACTLIGPCALAPPPVSSVPMKPIRFFDANVAVGPRKVISWGQPVAAADVFSRLRECGIEEALVFHTTAVENHPAVGNARIAEEIRGIPGAWPVWAMLPFTTNELGDEASLRRAMKDAGVKAVLVYPADHLYCGAEWCCGDLYDMLEDMRMPVFTRFSPADFTWTELAGFLSAHPKLPVVLRGVNYQVDRSAYRLLEKHPNLHIETARYLVFSGIEEVVRLFGSRRLVFGSEAPLLSPGAAVTPILTASIADADKERIAGDNLRELVQGVRYDA